MAGRPRVVRLKQSLVNYTDARTASGPMKIGLPPAIGVTRNYWYNYETQCNQQAGKAKRDYDTNMVFLSVNPAQTPVSAGFTPTVNNNYTYIRTGVPYNDANQKYREHYYRPYSIGEV